MAVTACACSSSILRALAATRRSLPLLSIHEGPGTIDELLDHHLSKKPPSSSSAALLDDEVGKAKARRRLMSSRWEALGLYRGILRATRLFEWPDERGLPWSEALHAKAWRDFEEARGEHNLEVIAWLLIGRCDTVEQALDRVTEASRRMVKAEEAKRHGGA